MFIYFSELLKCKGVVYKAGASECLGMVDNLIIVYYGHRLASMTTRAAEESGGMLTAASEAL